MPTRPKRRGRMLTGAATGLLLTAGLMAAATAVGSRRLDGALAATGAYATVEGVRLHYLIEGPDDGRPPVLVIHGASGNLNEPRLALRGVLADRRVLYVDRPGHGHSERPDSGGAAPAVQARLIAGLLDALTRERAVVVGHSLGAAVAAALAVEHPDKVAGLVFVSPATHPWPGGISWYYTAASDPVVGRAFAWTLAYPVGSLLVDRAAESVFAPEPVPERYRREAHIDLVLRPASFRANAEDVAGLKANVTAMAPRYREIRAPTVIVTGDSDTVVWPSIHSEGLKRDIPGAELVVLKGVGHMPHHTHAGVVAEAVARVSGD